MSSAEYRQSSPVTVELEEHFDALVAALGRNLRPAVARVLSWGEQLAAVYDRGGRLFACGNGGSAAEAQHLTAELTGRFRGERRPLSAISLHAETSSLTAILNDYGTDEMFARQLRAHGRPGDVLIALSTSGSSANVIAAAKAGHEIGLATWAMTGPSPNTLAALCDDAIPIEADTVATVQEMHLVLVHSLCAAVEAALEADS
ncbi:D-sedoheptulose-7-phosphate isomerase [Nocardia bhagyanarayanae]|uniref:D-sedoheptulose 7-phosphate isomerase n=1 Tax=Nocardia bhagyanarayanae TaxID=1215925 RepID=A0A543EYA2_9NOCA|nr:SIS domain-containing protein [Nocardia bhagyanarayanae]TQM26499.1 D-sedoheptulose 7-phosphate isomerase [Nocardia bhagyanarayanae]